MGKAVIRQGYSLGGSGEGAPKLFSVLFAQKTITADGQTLQLLTCALIVAKK